MSTTAKKPPTSTPKGDAPDAVKLLTADHKEVHTLFQQYKKLCEAQAPADERQPVAEKICGLLTVHATVEEEIFYPAAREAGVESALLDEAEVEHQTAKDLIAQLHAMDADDELYDAKVTVLGEYIDHHVEEEQNEMFPACRKAKMDLAALGAEIKARKAELMAELMGQPA
jgi:hemerythrin-like domain-containing protein